jgi:pimeloyl-ACP methyl ester carboxylesterase
VVAPPDPLRSLAFDAAAVRAVVEAIDGPVVLVGHSYGGAASAQEPFPPSLLGVNNYPTTYDAPGAPGGPDLYIKKEPFRETFCADLPVEVAEFMAVSQRPLSAAAFTEKCTAVGWREHPSWFLVSQHDNAIPPDAERFFAERMKATTEEINGSHCAFISQPVAVANFIKQALAR